MRNKTCYLLRYMSVIVSFEAFIQLTNLSKLQDPSLTSNTYRYRVEIAMQRVGTRSAVFQREIHVITEYPQE